MNADLAQAKELAEQHSTSTTVSSTAILGVTNHFRRRPERPFTRAERGHVTVLFGGLTIRHERLIAAALQGFGHKATQIPMPTKADFQAGKEYGNNGQCNPTYFTVGALVNYLKSLRDRDGVPTENILSDYVFVTVGSCGPCRFGMYEAEYRLALRNAGFDDFRVLIFNQAGELPDASVEAGLQMHPHFLAALTNAIFLGDLLNEVAYHIRPYETEPGATDRAFEKCLNVCQEVLRSAESGIRAGLIHKLLAGMTGFGEAKDYAGLIEQWRGRRYQDALRRCREIIDTEIEVDYTRPKPIAKITGEFWAQTTEGDGNFHMFRFLEREGAEVLVEPVATWIDYSIHYARLAARDRRGLENGGAPSGLWGRARSKAREAGLLSALSRPEAGRPDV